MKASWIDFDLVGPIPGTLRMSSTDAFATARRLPNLWTSFRAFVVETPGTAVSMATAIRSRRPTGLRNGGLTWIRFV